MHSRLSGLAAAALAVLAAPSLQEPGRSGPPAQSATAQDKKFVLDAGPHRIDALILDSATFLGRNCIVSKQELATTTNAQVELQTKLELDARGCEEVVSQLLYSAGFVLTRIDPARNLYEWIHASGPRRGEIVNRAVRMAPEEVMIRSALKTMVTCSVPLKHLDAGAVTNMLRPFFATNSGGSGALILGMLDRRTLIATGFTEEVAKLVRMVQDADLPPEKLEPTLEDRLAKIEARLAGLEKRAEPAAK